MNQETKKEERDVIIPEKVVEKLLSRQYLDDKEYDKILVQMPDNWRHEYNKSAKEKSKAQNQ